MSIHTYPNGIGGALGDSLVLEKPLITLGQIWYVSSLTGQDAASPRGLNREAPLATVAQAVTNAASNDIIVFLTGHSQTLAAVQTVGKQLTLVGEGFANGKPAVSFISNAANASIFNATVANVEFRNIYFPGNVQDNASPKVICGAMGRVVGCYFEGNSHDSASQLRIIDQSRIESSTFISVAVAGATAPFAAIASLGAFSGLEIANTIVSGGVTGWSSGWSVDLSDDTIDLIKISNLNLLLGADMRINTFSSGYIAGLTVTGGSRIDWG